MIFVSLLVQSHDFQHRSRRMVSPLSASFNDLFNRRETRTAHEHTRMKPELFRFWIATHLRLRFFAAPERRRFPRVCVCNADESGAGPCFSPYEAFCLLEGRLYELGSSYRSIATCEKRAGGFGASCTVQSRRATTVSMDPSPGSVRSSIEKLGPSSHSYSVF